MDCLIGLLKLQLDEGENVFMAHSLNCNISSTGKSKEEAVKKLANLLVGHIKTASDRNINPYVHDEEALEELMGYCDHNGVPTSLPDVEVGSGLRLRCYDLTN